MKEKRNKVDLTFFAIFKIFFANLIALIVISLITAFIIYLSLRNERIKVDYNTLDSLIEKKFIEREFAKPTIPDSVKIKKTK